MIHTDQNGQVMGKSTYKLERPDVSERINIADRDGQSALRGISGKAEALVAHAAKAAKRNGWQSAVRLTVADDRDFESVKHKFGLVDSDPDHTDYQPYAKVKAARGGEFTMSRVKKGGA